jgi:hypothetical protein
MNAPDHNRLLTSSARTELQPLGCRQNGRSRTWLDDQRWWVGVIEFQPSAWSKGSYLNVGVCWLWYEKDFYSFDAALGPYGSRLELFHEFDGSDAFAKAAQQLAQRAREEVLGLRQQLDSLSRAANFLESNNAQSNVWAHYHAGVAAGLVGKSDSALRHFRKVESEKADFDWVLQLKSRTAELMQAVGDAARFRADISSIVRRTRELLKLPSLREPLQLEP